MSSKRTIPYDDYLKLVGLFAVASDHEKALRAIHRAAAGITQEAEEPYGDSYFGVTSDAITQGDSVDQLLRALKIDVEKS